MFSSILKTNTFVENPESVFVRFRLFLFVFTCLCAFWFSLFWFVLDGFCLFLLIFVPVSRLSGVGGGEIYHQKYIALTCIGNPGFLWIKHNLSSPDSFVEERETGVV